MNLSAVLARAATLLAEHADAPTVCHVRVGIDAVFPGAGMPMEFRPEVAAQLASHGTFRQLRDVASWAQRLNATVAVDRCGDTLKISAITQADGGPVEVWTTISPDELAAALPPALAARCVPGARLPVADLLAALAATTP